MIVFDQYPTSIATLSERVDAIIHKPIPSEERRDILRKIFSLIDLTALEGTDNQARIKALCDKAIIPGTGNEPENCVAAVCVYPSMVTYACKALMGTGIRVASVAGGFPAGQTALFIKQAEVKFAIDEGAVEIDMVIPRGKLLEGNEEEILLEVQAIREVCNGVTLKVILETGELITPGLIRKASELAILGGADFIKTSTGKIPAGASPEAVLVMADTISEYFLKMGIMIGIKPSGGISDIDTALKYYLIVREVLGEAWLNPSFFRIGASRLADQIAAELR